ncbi:MAG: glycosyltransferase family 2 protein [Chloroflexi bacterium]|nr:glycosyltransferase family 2 protein [Chloroflexota bacterium]
MTSVSIIIPCYNEQKTISQVLRAIYAQTYPRQKLEVVIADGMSTDNTLEEIAAFQHAHSDLRIQVIENQRKTIPAGLNRALEGANGEVILRMDAHAEPEPDYVSRSVDGLDRGLGENVGGVWEILPGGEGWLASAIASAASHPVGIGDAKYRFTTKAQEVQTVPFGAFRRELIDEIGDFNEDLLANEDYEFNFRIRQAGGKIWLDPAIKAKYFARPTLKELAKQYWRYGFWKLNMLRENPGSIRWRQIFPPAFVSGIMLLILFSFLIPITYWILGFVVVSYTLTLLGVGLQLAIKKRSLSLIFGVPLAIATIHISWGSAFLWSFFLNPSDRPRRKQKKQ